MIVAHFSSNALFCLPSYHNYPVTGDMNLKPHAKLQGTSTESIVCDVKPCFANVLPFVGEHPVCGWFGTATQRDILESRDQTGSTWPLESYPGVLTCRWPV